MFLDGILNSGGIVQASQAEQYKKQQEEDQFFPASWGSDSVSISPEARAMQQAAETSPTEQNAEEKDAGDTALEEFKAYMDKKTSKAQSADPAEKIEELQNKLKQLQSQIASIASNKTMPEETKNAMTEALNAEINQVISEISELMSQLAEAKTE